MEPTASTLSGALEVALLEEKELCIDPELLLDAPRASDVDLASGAQLHLDYSRVMVKRGRADNELNAFRYDLVLFVGDAAALPPRAPLEATTELEWTGAVGEAGMVALRAALAQALRDGWRFIIVRGVPNLLLSQPHAMLDKLGTAADDVPLAAIIHDSSRAATSDADALLGTAERAELPSTAALLHDVGEELGLGVEVTWGQEEHLVDALFAVGAAKGTTIPHVSAFHGLRTRTVSKPSEANDDIWANAGAERSANEPLLSEIARLLIPSLRTTCEERLAAHMRPFAYVLTPSIPLTSNGKLDRSALAKRARGAVAAAAAVQAKDIRRQPGAVGSSGARLLTPLQSRLRSVWAQVLSLDESAIDLDDNFFRLGGDSLTSLRAVSAALAHGIELNVRDFFTTPTLRTLAAAPGPLAAIPSLSAPIHRGLFEVEIDEAASGKPFPLVGIQRAYWVGQQVGDPASGMGSLNPHIYSEYFLPLGCSAQLLGLSIDALVLRHPMLRAVVTEDGMLRVLSSSDVPAYTVRTIAHDDMEATRASMLAQGPRTDRFPLFDVRISHSASDAVHLHVSISLFLMDGFTELILRHELATLYAAAASVPAKPLTPVSLLTASHLPSIGLRFRDYACSMLARLPDTAAFAKSQSYWRGRLPNLSSAPELPQRPAEPAATTAESARFVHHGGSLPATEWSRILEQCAKRNVSPTVRPAIEERIRSCLPSSRDADRALVPASLCYLPYMVSSSLATPRPLDSSSTFSMLCDTPFTQTCSGSLATLPRQFSSNSTAKPPMTPLSELPS